MSTKASCTCLTRRGRPCRNPAAAGTNPPACARHRPRHGAEVEPGISQPSLPGLALSGDRPLDTDDWHLDKASLPADNFYFPRPTAADLPVLAATGPDAGLRPEVDLVRVVLRRLVAYLDENTGDLPPEELRRVAALVFSGARTVAMLAGKHAARPAEVEPWLLEALRHMGKDYGREL